MQLYQIPLDSVNLLSTRSRSQSERFNSKSSHLIWPAILKFGIAMFLYEDK